VNVTLSAPAAAINLWWPSPYGAQALYNVSVAVAVPGTAAITTARRIGFRCGAVPVCLGACGGSCYCRPAYCRPHCLGCRSTFALVTGNDTNPAYVAQNKNADGTDTQGRPWLWCWPSVSVASLLTRAGPGMLFRVNGMIIFSRGANMIPMEEMEVSSVRDRLCPVCFPSPRFTRFLLDLWCRGA
jgi:hypothetical protein